MFAFKLTAHYISIIALLLSQYVGATGYQSPALPFASEDILINQIKAQETLFWEIMNPILEGLELYSKILKKYYLPKYNQRMTVAPKPQYHEGIIEDFIEDNQRLYDIFFFADMGMNMLPIGEWMNMAWKISTLKNWKDARKLIMEARTRMAEPMNMPWVQGAVRPGPTSLAVQIRLLLDSWRNQVPFDVNGEIKRLLKTKKTNEDWMRWVWQMQQDVKVEPPTQWEPSLLFNPNRKEFWKWKFATLLLEYFARDVRLGAKEISMDQWHPAYTDGGDMKVARKLVKDLTQDGRDPEVMRLLKEFRTDPKKFPFKDLKGIVHPHQHPRGTEHLISDLIRVRWDTLGHLPTEIYNRNGHSFGNAPMNEQFERRKPAYNEPKTAPVEEDIKLDAPDGLGEDEDPEKIPSWLQGSMKALPVPPVWASGRVGNSVDSARPRGDVLTYSQRKIGNRQHYDLLHGDWHPLGEDSEDDSCVDAKSDEDEEDRERLTGFKDYVTAPVAAKEKEIVGPGRDEREDKDGTDYEDDEKLADDEEADA